MQLLRHTATLIGKLLAALLLLVVGCYVLIVIATSFTAGRQVAGDALSYFIPDLKVVEPRLSWSGNLSLERVSIADVEGGWLEVHSLTFNWAPLELLTGNLVITEIDVRKLSVARLPVEDESAAKTPVEPSGGSFSLPFRSIALKKLQVRDIDVASAVAGVPARVELNGLLSYQAEPAKISGQLRLTRLGQVQGTAFSEFNWDPSESTLNFKTSIFEAPNGLIANALKLVNVPSFALRLDGGGPISNWTASLQLDLDSNRAVDGKVNIQQLGERKEITTNLTGMLAQFLPPSISSAFLGETNLVATAKLDQSFIPLESSAKITTGTLLIHADNKYSPEGEVLVANAEVTTLETAGQPLEFRFGDQVVRFGTLATTASASGPLDKLSWDLTAQSSKVETNQAELDTISISARGENANLAADFMSVPIAGTLNVDGLILQDPRMAGLTDHLGLSFAGTLFPQQEKVELAQLHVEGNEFAAKLRNVEVTTTHGQTQGSLTITDLSPFSTLAQRQLSGSISTQFSVNADLTKNSGQIDFSGSSNKVSIGDDLADRVLISPTQFAARATASLNIDDILKSYGNLEALSIRSSAGEILANARLENGQVEGQFTTNLTKLSVLDPRVSGGLSVQGQVSGSADAPDVKLEASSSRLEMDGVPVEQLQLTIDAHVSSTAPTATVDLEGRLKGEALQAKLSLLSENGKLSLPILDINMGGNQIAGSLSAADIQNLPEGLIGHLNINAKDLSTLSPLALTELEGRAVGQIEIRQQNGDTQLEFNLSSEKLRLANSSIGSFKAEGWIDSPFTMPAANASIQLQSMEVEGVELNSLSIEAKPVGTQTDTLRATSFEVTALLNTESDRVDTSGTLEALSDGLKLTLNVFKGAYKGIQTDLIQPTTLVLRKNHRSVTPFELTVGSGSLVVSGSEGDALDIEAQMKRLPLSIANVFVPSLEVGGTLSGFAKIVGTVDAPQANWQMDVADLTAKPLKANGILPLQIKNSGTFAQNKLNQTTSVTNGSGLSLSSEGSADLGDAQTLAMRLRGTVPLEVVSAKLITQNIGGSGGFTLDGTVSGRLNDPQIAAVVKPEALQITQLSTGLTLDSFTGTLEASRKELKINALMAKFRNGGIIKVDGTLGLDSALPAQLDLTIDNGRYVDGTFVTALINANLSLNGSLGDAGAPPAIEGKVRIEQADIEIPSSFNSGINPVIVRHLNASKPILDQAKVLTRDEGRPTTEKNTEPSAMEKARLNIDVEAPGKIFIRGRGVTAEAGGSLNIGGTANNVQTVGAFSLVRGRIDILTKRLTLSRGNVTFSGSLVPFLDFAASSTSGTTEVTILVTGPADMPIVSFTSNPSLPQDEILSQLLFGQSVNDLSPIQLASLASAVATLSGGVDAEGPLSALRDLLGMSDIDVNFDADGNPELSVGGYLSEKIYVGVTQGPTTGDSAAAVDIDVTKYLKLRGESGSDGDAKAGFYYEREYD
ncbi:translocation/assembly module TamB domain-containing protein [Pseudovibrio sp. Tun.PSC04-5.I4]|uniref:translocation/assembly module TamB domain-containing protein n=1 Tax=Pseudovibrio sp. Tun.PSC04-5.I4 TaxID=1798213 RepID=UPI000890C313|nr:translocation/assembly module TamB domain-containing protein [Pseudovibrio sp. Tun.PSC04-5.I4]SDQ92039.1 autotransporter secretion inner membrane protein TamB [Pseudovibrio sp. Tun.PSC04-5.I4]